MAKRSAKELQHFDFTLSDDDFKERMSKPYVPIASNTKASDFWAVTVFSEWYKSRTECNRSPVSCCPTLTSKNYFTLCLCLLTTHMLLCTTLVFTHYSHVFTHYSHVLMQYSHVFMHHSHVFHMH